jgi:uncharacterized damage-inducible protein DinB
MTDSMSDRYRRWFEYETNAHAKVIAALGTVPPDQRESAPYRKAVELLAHIVVGRQVWLHRIDGSVEAPSALFPQGASVDAVQADLSAVEGSWAVYLAKLTDAELARELEYRSFDGRQFRNRVEDVLTQLYGHSLYHRGQIAMLVRAAGGEPAMTDFIFWAREAVA